MIDVEAIRRLNNFDTDALIAVLELMEDHLYHWLVLGSVTEVRDDLDRSIEYVKALRQTVRSERPDYVSPYRALLPVWHETPTWSYFPACWIPACPDFASSRGSRNLKMRRN